MNNTAMQKRVNGPFLIGIGFPRFKIDGLPVGHSILLEMARS
jgi:hypothetical protein